MILLLYIYNYYFWNQWNYLLLIIFMSEINSDVFQDLFAQKNNHIYKNKCVYEE